jgi:hypothetical protein
MGDFDVHEWQRNGHEELEDAVLAFCLKFITCKPFETIKCPCPRFSACIAQERRGLFNLVLAVKDLGEQQL